MNDQAEVTEEKKETIKAEEMKIDKVSDLIAALQNLGLEKGVLVNSIDDGFLSITNVSLVEDADGKKIVSINISK